MSDSPLTCGFWWAPGDRTLNPRIGSARVACRRLANHLVMWGSLAHGSESVLLVCSIRASAVARGACVLGACSAAPGTRGEDEGVAGADLGEGDAFDVIAPQRVDVPIAGVEPVEEGRYRGVGDRSGAGVFPGAQHAGAQPWGCLGVGVGGAFCVGR